MSCWSCDDGVSKRRKQGAGIERAQRLHGVEPEGNCTGDGSGVGDGSGGIGVSVDAIGTGTEDSEHLAGMVSQLKRTSEGELLIASARSRCAIHGDGDFAARDQTKAPMGSTQIMESVQEVARRVSIIPVVAGVVYSHKVAGLLRQDAGILNQVVAGEQELEDGIAKRLVLAGHGCSRSDTAGKRGLGARQF